MVSQALRIMQVSTADIGGGAEKIAWNLFNNYRVRGISSRLVVGRKLSTDPDVLVLPDKERRGRWYGYFHTLATRYRKVEAGVPAETSVSRLFGGVAEPARRLTYHLGIEDFHFPASKDLQRLCHRQADLLHTHNLHGAYFDLRFLPSISQHLPTLMTLHDAWLLSGHCAHSFDCERWKTGCGKCPDLSIYPAIRRDATHYNWLRKRSIYARCRLFIATPSRWLMDKVGESILLPAIVDARVIPNGIDLNKFHPAARNEAREALGIRPDRHVLLAIGTRFQGVAWKDTQTLRQAIFLLSERLPGQDILFLILGSDTPVEQIEKVEMRAIPYQEDARIVARYYQAADVYVHISKSDTFPTSILEAMACGTPVVATAVGGIPEQIEDARHGFLILPGDAARMADRIALLLSDPIVSQPIGTLAAERAREFFSLDRQADSYLDWYEEIISYPIQ